MSWKLQVVVTTYNPSKSLEKCLDSIEKQTFTNYDLCLVDDASNKDLLSLNETIRHYCRSNQWKFLRHKHNTGPLKSRIDALSMLDCQDQDIIILIDGDDYLYSSDVFETIYNLYLNNDILISVGSFVIEVDNQIYPDTIYNMTDDFFTPEKREELRKNNSYREDKWMYPPLRTFKYQLYKHIQHEDLKKDGEYLQAATDRALFYPLLELCNGKFMYITKILYVYVHDHPESYHNHPQKKIIQAECAEYLTKLPKYELKLTT